MIEYLYSRPARPVYTVTGGAYRPFGRTVQNIVKNINECQVNNVYYIRWLLEYTVYSLNIGASEFFKHLIQIT